MSKKTPVIWFTGLPCSGKTTLALEVKKILNSRNIPCELLDGDEIRAKLGNFNFSEQARELHITYVGLMAAMLQSHGIIPIASLVSPLNSARLKCRKLSKDFIEIYLSASLETCESRDIKGCYKKAREGVLPNFTGIDAKYEIPNSPEITIDTGKTGIEESMEQIKEYLNSLNLLG